jgi:hypothetical protein
MFATIRRYEAIDQARTSELAKKADESLLPSLSESKGALVCSTTSAVGRYAGRTVAAF